MTIMSIIITEEDLCKKHAKKCAEICKFSSLPLKCFQAANDPNTKNDSKPHISAYNYNTRTGFRLRKKNMGVKGTKQRPSVEKLIEHVSNFTDHE